MVATSLAAGGGAAFAMDSSSNFAAASASFRFFAASLRRALRDGPASGAAPTGSFGPGFCGCLTVPEAPLSFSRSARIIDASDPPPFKPLAPGGR